MDKVKRLYKEAFQKYGNSVNSVFLPKGRQDIRFRSLTHYLQDNSSLLDYGCGLGQLKLYVMKHFNLIDYSGCDNVEEFISENQKTIDRNSYFHISNYKDIKKKYDYINMSGVFNLMYKETKEEQFPIIISTLQHLFNQTNSVLSVDFMTDQVDFVAENAYHQNIQQIYQHIFEHLSRRIVIDQSYLPYEYTIHIFKDDAILRPDNTYNEL